MKVADILMLPSMPACAPSYPMGPYRFVNREYMIVTYETDPQSLRAAVPEPLKPNAENQVLYEWIRMPDSSGFGDYTESGTFIYSAGKQIPVESLAIGSTLQSQLGGLAKCRWIGYQRRTPEFAQFQDYLPVKISAGALDDHVPLRDLYLSPDHAVLVDGHLIHAKALVNGKTIVQMTQWAGDIEYYHVETEAHEIIYAEGVPCETFIDNVSREQFDNYAEYQALYPNTRMMKELPLPRVKFKRQLPTMIKQRLESRISELDRQKKG